MWLKKDILTKKDKADFKIAIVVVIVFSFFVYKLMYRNSNEELAVNLSAELNASEKNKAYEKSSLEESVFKESSKWKTLTIKAEDALQVSVDSVVVVSDVVNNNNPIVIKEITEDITTIENKIDVSLETETVLENQIDIDEVVSEINENDANTNENVSESIENANTEIIESSEELESNVDTTIDDSLVKEEETVEEQMQETIEETKVEVKSDESLGCVIVVGAFKEHGNKEAVIEKLTSLGYSYSEGVLRTGLNYVGVPVDCNNKQVKQKLLSELNESFNINSWIKKK